MRSNYQKPVNINGDYKTSDDRFPTGYTLINDRVYCEPVPLTFLIVTRYNILLFLFLEFFSCWTAVFSTMIGSWFGYKTREHQLLKGTGSRDINLYWIFKLWRFYCDKLVSSPFSWKHFREVIFIGEFWQISIRNCHFGGFISGWAGVFLNDCTLDAYWSSYRKIGTVFCNALT